MPTAFKDVMWFFDVNNMKSVQIKAPTRPGGHVAHQNTEQKQKLIMLNWFHQLKQHQNPLHCNIT